MKFDSIKSFINHLKDGNKLIPSDYYNIYKDSTHYYYDGKKIMIRYHNGIESECFFEGILKELILSKEWIPVVFYWN